MSDIVEFSIIKVVNSNTPEEEHVLLRATKEQSISLNGYALLDNTFNEKGKSNIHKHVFIFPNVTIEAGDYVKVFTGRGDITSVKNDKGTKTHRLYIQSNECIWNDKNQDSAILWKFNEINRVSVFPK